MLRAVILHCDGNATVNIVPWRRGVRNDQHPIHKDTEKDDLSRGGGYTLFATQLFYTYGFKR